MALPRRRETRHQTTTVGSITVNDLFTGYLNDGDLKQARWARERDAILLTAAEVSLWPTRTIRS